MNPRLSRGMSAAADAVSASAMVRRGYRIALCAALALGTAVPAAAQTASEEAAAPSTEVNDFQGPQSFATLAEAKLPAVVNVSTTRGVEVAEGSPPGMPEGMPDLPPGSPFEEFFREFFGDRVPRGPFPEPPMGDMMAVGSGFIIDPEGYIVTNNHVVAEAEKIIVTLQDETELTAEVVGRDPRTDLALLKVETDEPLPSLEWGDSDAIRVGDWVMAVGNPFGLGGTVTTGIISARARDINAGPYDDFLQTDASINQGNSGGPLFGMDGKVVGVATAIFSPSGGNIGIGFAVPSALASDVVAELRETGTVRRGWLGVSIQPVTEDIADAVGLDEERGALVAEVLPDTPAAEAGIEAGDVILSFAGQRIDDPDELSRIVADTEVGESVEVDILREGEQQSLEATIALLEEQDQLARVEPTPQEETAGADALGLSLAELSPELREQYGISEETEGVLVVDVEEGSVAAEENIAPGDIITKVGRRTVSEPQEVVSAVEEARQADQDSVLLLRERNGDPAFIALPTQAEQG